MQKYIFYLGTPKNIKNIDNILPNGYYFKIWEPNLYKIAPKGLISFPFIIYWICCYFFKFFKNSNYKIFLIYYNNEIAHYSVVLPKFLKTPFMKKNDLQIGPIGTKKEHRKKGLAAYAIKKILELYENQRFWYLTREENMISGKVIKKFGFKKQGKGIKKGKLGIFSIQKNIEKF